MAEQAPIVIDRSEIVSKATELKNAGNRLVQICCTTLADSFEITYSFDKEYALTNLRVIAAKSDPVVPSITGAYLAAFTYENELQDLFGLKITDMALNFNGKFYQTAIKTPFNVAKTDTAGK